MQQLWFAHKGIQHSINIVEEILNDCFISGDKFSAVDLAADIAGHAKQVYAHLCHHIHCIDVQDYLTNHLFGYLKAFTAIKVTASHIFSIDDYENPLSIEWLLVLSRRATQTLFVKAAIFVTLLC